MPRYQSITMYYYSIPYYHTATPPYYYTTTLLYYYTHHDALVPVYHLGVHYITIVPHCHTLYHNTTILLHYNTDYYYTALLYNYTTTLPHYYTHHDALVPVHHLGVLLVDLVRREELVEARLLRHLRAARADGRAEGETVRGRLEGERVSAGQRGRA
jgi:hypothetical protein